MIYPYSREAAPQPESPRFSENMFFSYPPEIRTNKEQSHCQQASPKMVATMVMHRSQKALQALLGEHAPVMQKRGQWPRQPVLGKVNKLQ